MNDINTKYVADMLQACLAHYCNENGDWLALLRQQLGLRIQRAEPRLFIDGRDVHVLAARLPGQQLCRRRPLRRAGRCETARTGQTAKV